jgi:cytochrome P450
MIKGGGFLVKDSVAAVESLASAWAKDIEKGGHKKHSSFIQKLCEYYIERNFPSKDIAQFVTGSAVAVLGNTLPTAFWFVAHLYSDRKVFEACREEILAQVVHGKDESGNPVRTVDITALKVACPLLHSAFKEVLRLEAVGTGARGVEEDHMLDGNISCERTLSCSCLWCLSTSTMSAGVRTQKSIATIASQTKPVLA